MKNATLVRMYKFGLQYPMAIKVLQTKIAGVEVDSDMEYLLMLFKDNLKQFNEKIINESEENLFNYIISKDFLNTISVRLSNLSNDLLASWMLGKAKQSHKFLQKHSEQENKKAIDVLEIQIKEFSEILKINASFSIEKVEENLIKLESEEEKMSATTINIKKINGKTVVVNNDGEMNIHTYKQELTAILNKFNEKNIKEDEKKNLLKEILGHPLFTSIVGGIIKGSV